MTILNQQKSALVPVVRLVNTIFFYFFSFVELTRQFHVLVRFLFCKMTRLAMIFLKILIFFKNIFFRVKSPFLPSISQKNFVVLNFPKENTFLYLKMLINLEPRKGVRRGGLLTDRLLTI